MRQETSSCLPTGAATAMSVSTRRHRDRKLLSSAALAGVLVRGLVWRSHLDTLQFSKEENRHFGRVFYPLHSGPTQTSAT